VRTLIAVGSVFLFFVVHHVSAQPTLSVPFICEWANTSGGCPAGNWQQSANCGPTSVLMVASSSNYNNTPLAADQISQADTWLYTQFGGTPYFYGNPAANDDLGYGTNTTELVALAAGMFGLANSNVYSGWTLSQLQQELANGYPVIVYVYQRMEISSGDSHYMVLLGMDSQNVYVNDPGLQFGGQRSATDTTPGRAYPLNLFEAAWAAHGNSGVTIHPNHAQTQPSWTQLTINGASVSGRETPSAVLDPSTNRLILFGGIAVTGSCCNSYTEVWVLTNANGIGGTPSWTQLTPSAPSGLPPARSSHSAVYDSASNRMVIFGGGQFGGSIFNTLFNDAWVLTNANGLGGTPTWLPLSPVGGPPAAREGQHALYDQQNNRMIVFGGGNNGIEDVPNDVWVLTNANGLGGTAAWNQLSPTGVLPSRRENFAAGYDPSTNRMMIFGGCCYWTNDSWLLTNANGLGGPPRWTQLSPLGTLPGIRQTPAFAYDPSANFLLIFGIGGAGAIYNDTWTLSNANGSPGNSQWVNLIPNGAANSPPIISGYNTSSASAYDPTNQRLISLKNAPDGSGGAVLQTWVLALH